MSTLLTSLQNSRVKEIVKLEKRNERDLRQVTIVEGAREVSRALAKGIVPTELYICDELLTKEIGDWRLEMGDRRSIHQPPLHRRHVGRQSFGLRQRLRVWTDSL